MEQQNLREVARSSWTEARKIRQTILQKIKDLRDSLEDRQGSNVNLTARLEGIENLMKELRLASMAVIFYDFEYADEKDVEAQLWQAHVVFNGEYRQIAVRQNQVVLKRKVDKLYRDFLKTSQFFYRGYIQRLSGRFWIPELQHAARGLDIEPLETPQRDHTPPATLREKLVKSCYLTLIRLGDLARYRCQMNDKPPKASFDIALTYYGLANTLDVDDGSSYHQTALLYQPSAQHLEIIYYFHRSVCVAKPHKFGVGNLERAFKSFLDNQSGPRPGARNSSTDDASEALTKWFLRLHAHYSQGVVFSAREELEKEVLHRFRLYLRVEGNEDLALKLLLINIAAGDIAFENVKDSSNWTIERSRSCQHLLTFNIRVAVVLFRLFKSALQDNASTATVKFQENHAESKVEFSPSVQKLLRLTRICIAWIYAVRLNLIQYQEWLEPQIRELYCLLADTLTLLLPYILWDEEVVESKYLLPEDTEAGGLRILSHRKLPLFQDVQIIPGYTPPKVRRAVKPRKEALGLAYSPHTESVWRIRDIVCCGIYLAGSGKSPLTIVTTTDGEINKWVYNQDGNIQIHLDEAVMTRTFAQLKMSALRVPGEEDDLVDLNAADPNYPMSRTPGNHQRTLPEHLARQTAMAQAAAEARQISQPAHLNFAGQSTKTTEDGYNRGQDMSIDSDMIDMVNKLIDSDDDEDDTRPVSSKVTADTSYGMDSSAANDIFGGFMASPHVSTGDPATNVPPTVFSSGKTIPNLPWNYFYSPSTSNGPDISYADANGYNVPRTVGAQNQGVATATSYTGQLASPIRGSYDQNFSPGAFGRSMDSNSNGVSNTRATPRSSAENRRPSGTTPGTTVSSPKALDTVKGSDYPTSQQNSALDNLRAALYAQYGPGATSSLQSPTYGKQNDPQPPVQGHRGGASGSFKFTDFRGSPSSTEAENARDRTTQDMTYLQRDRRLTGENIKTSNDSVNGAADHGDRFPLTFGSPAGNGYGYSRPSGQVMRYSGLPGSPDPSNNPFAQQMPTGYEVSASPLAFSHPSSLWTGTPDQPHAPAGTINCNGNLFNGTTPFGRSGNVNNREDPTHFRNRLKGLGGSESIMAFDRAILESALTDNTNPRPHQQ